VFPSVVLWIVPSLVAQAANHPGPKAAVPFVGCVSYGQVEKLEAPTGTNRAVPISPASAEKLAYYQSADGIGVLGPRGWYCEGNSGSGGVALYLSPVPIIRGPDWRGFEGPGLETWHVISESSGMYEAAEIIARAFPAYRALAQATLRNLDGPVPAGPYPTDHLTYKNESVLEYETPPETEGLGTDSTWLRKSDLPISGAAILIADSPGSGRVPDVLLLAVRLPPELAALAPVIVRQVERDARDRRK